MQIKDKVKGKSLAIYLRKEKVDAQNKAQGSYPLGS